MINQTDTSNVEDYTSYNETVSLVDNDALNEKLDEPERKLEPAE